MIALWQPHFQVSAGQTTFDREDYINDVDAVQFADQSQQRRRRGTVRRLRTKDNELKKEKENQLDEKTRLVNVRRKDDEDERLVLLEMTVPVIVEAAAKDMAQLSTPIKEKDAIGHALAPNSISKSEEIRISTLVRSKKNDTPTDPKLFDPRKVVPKLSTTTTQTDHMIRRARNLQETPSTPSSNEINPSASEALDASPPAGTPNSSSTVVSEYNSNNAGPPSDPTVFDLGPSPNEPERPSNEAEVYVASGTEAATNPPQQQSSNAEVGGSSPAGLSYEPPPATTSSYDGSSPAMTMSPLPYTTDSSIVEQSAAPQGGGSTNPTGQNDNSTNEQQEGGGGGGTYATEQVSNTYNNNQVGSENAINDPETNGLVGGGQLYTYPPGQVSSSNELGMTPENTDPVESDSLGRSTNPSAQSYSSGSPQSTTYPVNNNFSGGEANEPGQTFNQVALEVTSSPEIGYPATEPPDQIYNAGASPGTIYPGITTTNLPGQPNNQGLPQSTSFPVNSYPAGEGTYSSAQGYDQGGLQRTTYPVNNYFSGGETSPPGQSYNSATPQATAYPAGSDPAAAGTHPTEQIYNQDAPQGTNYPASNTMSGGGSSPPGNGYDQSASQEGGNSNFEGGYFNGGRTNPPGVINNTGAYEGTSDPLDGSLAEGGTSPLQQPYVQGSNWTSAETESAPSITEDSTTSGAVFPPNVPSSESGPLPDHTSANISGMQSQNTDNSLTGSIEFNTKSPNVQENPYNDYSTSVTASTPVEQSSPQMPTRHHRRHRR